jgi:hypothetical protein
MLKVLSQVCAMLCVGLVAFSLGAMGMKIKCEEALRAEPSASSFTQVADLRSSPRRHIWAHIEPWCGWHAKRYFWYVPHPKGKPVIE